MHPPTTSKDCGLSANCICNQSHHIHSVLSLAILLQLHLCACAASASAGAALVQPPTSLAPPIHFRHGTRGMDNPGSNAEDEVALIYRSPLGPLKLVANPEGICSVKWLFGKHSEEPEGSGISTRDARQERRVTNSTANRLQDTPVTSEKSAAVHLKVCTTWLDAYFNSSLLKDTPPRPPLVFPTKAAKG